MTNIFLLDGGWLRGDITGHPSSSISSPSTSQTLLPTGRPADFSAFGWVQPLTKKFSKIKKKEIFFFYLLYALRSLFCKFMLLQALYIIMYKILKNQYCIWTFFGFFFKIIKVTALPIYSFLFEIKFLYVINAGIEPAFSVNFGNRTRIYFVLRESNPDCKALYVGDGWRYGNMEKKFYVDLVSWAWKVFYYLGSRTLGTYLMMVKSFWGDNDVVLKYCCYWNYR